MQQRKTTLHWQSRSGGLEENHLYLPPITPVRVEFQQNRQLEASII